MPEPVFPSDDALKDLVNNQATIDEILQAAWRSICAAGVLQTETDEGVVAMPHLKLEVTDGALQIDNEKTGQKLTWALAGSTVPDGVAGALADALVAVLNSPPSNINDFSWGWHKNVEKNVET
jgi:hypothetical protein